MSEALESMVQQGQALVRIENKQQTLVAVQRPRDEEAVLKKAIAELHLVPEMADKAYYSIPYKDKSGKVTNVEGLTIKSAMAILRRWGNSSNGARVVEEYDDYVIVEGVFVDYETNVRTLRTVRVAKRAKNKAKNEFYYLAPDRLNMAIQAGMSKAVRNAALATIPVGVTETYFQTAKQLVSKPPAKPGGGQAPTLDQIYNRAKAAIIKLGATPEEVESYCKMRLEDGSLEELVQHLRGLWTAVNEGFSTIESIFSDKDGVDPLPPLDDLEIPEDESDANHAG